MRLLTLLCAIGVLALVLTSCARPNAQSKPMQVSAGISGPTDDQIEQRIVNLQILMEAYRCDQMIALVNTLQTLGKERALEVLNDFYVKAVSMSPNRDPISQLKIMCICRVLFQPPPKGWQEPWSEFNAAHNDIMQDTWRFGKESRSAFSLYPVVMSDGVPFILARGYTDITAAPSPLFDDARTCLDTCRELQLINSNLPIKGHDQAALKLIHRQEFGNLFKDPEHRADADHMALSIVLEAIDSNYLMFGNDQSPKEEATAAQ